MPQSDRDGTRVGDAQVLVYCRLLFPQFIVDGYKYRRRRPSNVRVRVSFC